MQHRLFYRSHVMPAAQRAMSTERLLLKLIIVAISLSAFSRSAVAGSGEKERTTHAVLAKLAASPAPKYILTSRPHLLTVGPMGINLAPLTGPRLRRPPLLPPPKLVEPEPESDHTPSPAPEDAAAKPAIPAEPSAFSPDAAPTLLPEAKAPTEPATEKHEENRDRALEANRQAEPDLKDAVIYFEAPPGPQSGQVYVPLVTPLTSPAGAPQPESRASYRKEKK